MILATDDTSKQLERESLEKICSASLKTHAQHGHTVTLIKKIQTQLNLGGTVENL